MYVRFTYRAKGSTHTYDEGPMTLPILAGKSATETAEEFLDAEKGGPYEITSLRETQSPARYLSR